MIASSSTAGLRHVLGSRPILRKGGMIGPKLLEKLAVIVAPASYGIAASSHVLRRYP